MTCPVTHEMLLPRSRESGVHAQGKVISGHPSGGSPTREPPSLANFIGSVDAGLKVETALPFQSRFTAYLQA